MSKKPRFTTLTCISVVFLLDAWSGWITCISGNYAYTLHIIQMISLLSECKAQLRPYCVTLLTSVVFVSQEHVFWVVSLNTLFILVFGEQTYTKMYNKQHELHTLSCYCCFVFFFFLAFCPYHIGHFSVVGLGFEEYVRLYPSS